MTRPRSPRYEPDAKEPAKGKFMRQVMAIRQAEAEEKERAAQREKYSKYGAYSENPYLQKVYERRQARSKRKARRFTGPWVRPWMKDDTDRGRVISKLKESFWVVVDKLVVHDETGYVRKHRFQVQGFPIRMWRTYKKQPRSKDTVRHEYRLFAYRDRDNDWRICEQLTGVELGKGPTLEHAYKNFLESFDAAQEQARKNEGPSMVERLSEHPEVDSLPEMDKTEAMRILCDRLNEKRVKRERRRINSQYRKSGGISDLGSRD